MINFPNAKIKARDNFLNSDYEKKYYNFIVIVITIYKFWTKIILLYFWCQLFQSARIVLGRWY